MDNAIARSTASFVGNGGGLCDLSVKASECPSICCRVGVSERVCRSRCAPSLLFMGAEDARSSSLFWCPEAIPAHSPDIGRPLENSGDADSGVKAP